MKKRNIKYGISLVSLAIIIIVMIILAGVVVTTSFKSIDTANIKMFAMEIADIKTNVDNYYLKHNAYPIGDTIEYTVPENTTDFADENINDGIVTLKEINISQIGLKNLNFGNKKETYDVYAMSQITGKVYYLLGVKYNSKINYTLNEDVEKIAGVNYLNKPEYNEITEYDVIFKVNNTKPTNLPVTVIVKVPKSATINSITATNSKVVSQETVELDYKKYTVNETGENRNGNYVIEVNYIYNGSTKTAKYTVTNFNNTDPQITYTTTTTNGLTTVNVNVTGNNIDKIKYETAYISNSSYFDNYGKNVINNSFKILSNKLFTVYVKDKEGNTAIASNFKNINPGDYIEYNVAYTDMIEPSNVYSNLNGWRVFKATKNQDGSYSNVILISTGVPAKIYWFYGRITQTTWGETDEEKLEEFKNILTNNGTEDFVFYTGNNVYNALQASAGLFFNFEEMLFQYATEERGFNLAYFTSITSNGVTYNNTSNSTVEKNGKELFNLYQDKSIVRVLTLPEINKFLGRSDTDSITTITAINDPNGLLRLSGITNVPNLENFSPYTAYSLSGTTDVDKAYLIASPRPHVNLFANVLSIFTGGDIYGQSKEIKGIRPAICFNSNIYLIDTNNNNVPEIVFAN